MASGKGGQLARKKFVVKYLPLDEIDISRHNVRRSRLSKGIEELAGSIEEIGVQQPVVVFKKRDDRYELVIGQRRYLACKRLGMKEIPALITSAKNATEAAIASFSENIHRLALDYRDKMQVSVELLDKLGSEAEVASRLGVTRQTVRRYLGYAAVPETIKAMVDEGMLTASLAIRIASRIPDDDMALSIAKKVSVMVPARDRGLVVDVAGEYPDRTVDEILDIAKKRRFRKVTINLTPRLAEALAQAHEDHTRDPDDIVIEALEQWLENEGFI